MTNYEYQTVKVPRSRKDQTAALSRYGQQGWEVVEIKDSWQKHVTVTMKRDTAHPAAGATKPPGLLSLIVGAIARKQAAK